MLSSIRWQMSYLPCRQEFNLRRIQIMYGHLFNRLILLLLLKKKERDWKRATVGPIVHFDTYRWNKLCYKSLCLIRWHKLHYDITPKVSTYVTALRTTYIVISTADIGYWWNLIYLWSDFVDSLSRTRWYCFPGGKPWIIHIELQNTQNKMPRDCQENRIVLVPLYQSVRSPSLYINFVRHHPTVHRFDNDVPAFADSRTTTEDTETSANHLLSFWFDPIVYKAQHKHSTLLAFVKKITLSSSSPFKYTFSRLPNW